MGIRTRTIAAQVANSFSNATNTQTLTPTANVTFESLSSNTLSVTTITSSGLATSLGLKANLAGAAFTGAVSGITTLAAGNTTITGSLTASANVNFDSGTLFVDGANNRVGINNTAPTSALTVTGNAAFSNTVAIGGEYISPHTGFKNRLINGAMVIDQRNAGASVTPTSDGQYGSCDRWNYWLSQASKFSAQQSSTAPTGFSNSLLITSLSAYSVTGNDYFSVNQKIEGFNFADMMWGTANAQTVTLSFWVRSSLTGTFGGAMTNSAFNRSYPFSYTINAANTWEQKTVTIAGDTTGTWVGATNGVGAIAQFNLGSVASKLGTANTWAGSWYTGATGATSVVGTNGATFYITGVQLEKGSTATSFDWRPYGTELQLCRRYYEGMYTGEITETDTYYSGWKYLTPQRLFVEKRATPTVTVLSQGGWPNGAGGTYSVSGTTQHIAIIGLSGNALNNNLHSYTLAINAEL